MTRQPLRAISLDNAIQIAQDFAAKLWNDEVHSAIVAHWNKARRSRRVATFGVQAKTIHKWVSGILNKCPKAERRSTRAR